MSIEEDIAEQQHWLQSLEIGSNVAICRNDVWRIESVIVAARHRVTTTSFCEYNRRNGWRVNAGGFPQEHIEPVTESVINAIRHQNLVRKALDILATLSDKQLLQKYTETGLVALIHDLEKYTANKE